MVNISVKDLFVPTKFQAAMSSLASALILLITFHTSILERILGNQQQNVSLAEPVLRNNYLTILAQLSGYRATNYLVEGAFWAGVGLLAYIVYLTITNIIIEARNEAVVEATYTNKGSAEARFKRPLTQIMLGLLIFILLVVSAQLLTPTYFDWFANLVRLAPQPLSLLQGLAAVVALAVNIYIIWMLTVLTFAIE